MRYRNAKLSIYFLICFSKVNNEKVNVFSSYFLSHFSVKNSKSLINDRIKQFICTNNESLFLHSCKKEKY